MITITHYKGGAVGVHCRPGEALYALGLKEANHPVPAIIIRWQYDAQGPFVVRYQQGEGDDLRP